MSIKALAHVCIKAADLEQTLKFYRDGIGLTPLFDFTRNGEPIGFYLRIADGAYLEVFNTTGAPGSQARRILDHFCIETDAIETLRERLLEHGYFPGAIKLGCDQSWQFWVNDPDGVAIEFHQYTPDSAQLTRKNVEVDW